MLSTGIQDAMVEKVSILIIYIRAQLESRLTSYLLTLADLQIEPILWLFNHSKHATQVHTPINSTM